MNFNKKVAFHTLGCKVNQYETESIRNQLLKKGYSEVDFDDESDVYIVNSCTVTSVADRKTRNMLRRAKKINPDSTVIITGCYAETNSRELLEIEDVDFVIGNKNKSSIISFVDSIEKIKTEIVNETIFSEKEYQEYEFATLREMSRAYVKIQDGCDQFCSYCKIPFARGKSRSRIKKNVLNEINHLVNEGFKEVILIGINIGAYGEDMIGDETFESLLKSILEIEGLERVRIGSVYPDKITDELISLFENKKLMPHLHISLQSCDDTVLKNMRRQYGSDLIRDKLLLLKSKVENLEYTADIIVGFPGESDEMFENTYSLIQEIGFSNLHIFKYSDREGTIAINMKTKIDAKKKKERADKLEKLRDEMFKATREKYINKEVKVLVEESKNGTNFAYTENYLKIKYRGSENEINQLKKLRVASVEKGELLAYE